MIPTSPSNAVIIEHIAEIPEAHHITRMTEPTDRNAVVIANLCHTAPFSTHLKMFRKVNDWRDLWHFVFAVSIRLCHNMSYWYHIQQVVGGSKKKKEKASYRISTYTMLLRTRQRYLDFKFFYKHVLKKIKKVYTF